MDTLSESFEITRSGTFKRGEFALNNKGMTTLPTSHLNNAVEDNDYDEYANEEFESEDPNTSPKPLPSLSTNNSARSDSSSASTPASASLSSTFSSSSSSSVISHNLSKEDFVILNVLGRGSSGVVYKCFYAPTMELVALKVISVIEKDKRKQLTRELRTLTLPSHPHTIGFRGAYYDEENVYIALEYMSEGSLQDLSDHINGALSEHACAYIFEQVLHGLAFLHQNQHVHRDIVSFSRFFSRNIPSGINLVIHLYRCCVLFVVGGTNNVRNRIM